MVLKNSMPTIFSDDVMVNFYIRKLIYLECCLFFQILNSCIPYSKFGECMFYNK